MAYAWKLLDHDGLNFLDGWKDNDVQDSDSPHTKRYECVRYGSSHMKYTLNPNKDFRRHMINYVLATDLTYHSGVLKDWNSLTLTPAGVRALK